MSYAAFFWRNKVQRHLFPQAYRRWWNREFRDALNEDLWDELSDGEDESSGDPPNPPHPGITP